MTAEEFFRNKIKEKNPLIEIITLSSILVTAEEAMRWSYEFNQLVKSEIPIIPEISDEEIEDVAWEKFITDLGRFGFISGAKWYREQLKKK